MRPLAVVILLAVLSHGCAGLGYSDRVFHRVPSPRDSTLIAVCQEVPASTDHATTYDWNARTVRWCGVSTASGW